ncbi:MAG: Hpt domain-containing protein [Deltaproteobacteria bacterium]|nr:Hpt domain-containing protein [Deltaproteobacteria bacterium]
MDLETELVDLNIINSRKEIDIEFWNTIKDIFLRDAPKTMALLQQSFIEEDFQALYEFGHKLKGMAANVGAVVLQDIFSQIEIKGKTSELSGVEDLLEQMAKKYDLTIKIFGEL